MNHELIISESILINKDVLKVWDALTLPEIIKQYLFGTETITDWKVGSEIIFQGEYNGVKYKDKGVVKENILHNKISYSYWSGFSGVEDKPENYSQITYLLEKKPDGTRLTWMQKGFASEAGHNHSKDGMNAFLKSIKNIIETN